MRLQHICICSEWAYFHASGISPSPSLRSCLHLSLRNVHFLFPSPLHSSIGLAKAALESMNRLNLFGEQGSSFSIIHVDPDAQYRNCVILNTLLPKESSSKESDASLLFITGYPGFSIDDPTLCKRTEDRVKELCEVCGVLVCRQGYLGLKDVHSARSYRALFYHHFQF